MTPRQTGNVDVSGLPSVVFGQRALLWWGTLGFALIEGFSLVLTIASYLYLRQNEFDWPPGRTPNPDLLIPTVNTVLLLAMIVPMHAVDRAAKAFDGRGVRRNFAIATVMGAVVMTLRWWELLALNVRWDTHAYGSAAWAVVLMHSTLVIVDVFESATFCAIFRHGTAERKHYPDASDAAGYQYFLSLAWIPVYVVVFWLPRIL